MQLLLKKDEQHELETRTTNGSRLNEKNRKFSPSPAQKFPWCWVGSQCWMKTLLHHVLSLLRGWKYSNGGCFNPQNGKANVSAQHYWKIVRQRGPEWKLTILWTWHIYKLNPASGYHRVSVENKNTLLTLENPRNDNFLICVVSFDEWLLPESLMTNLKFPVCHNHRKNYWIESRYRQLHIPSIIPEYHWFRTLYSPKAELLFFLLVITTPKPTANWTVDFSSRTFLNYFSRRHYLFLPRFGRYLVVLFDFPTFSHLFSHTTLFTRERGDLELKKYW